MRYLLLIILLITTLITCSCSGYRSYSSALELYESGNYFDASLDIQAAMKAEPNNEKYIDLSDKITVELYNKKEDILKSTTEENVWYKSVVTDEMLELANKIINKNLRDKLNDKTTTYKNNILSKVNSILSDINSIERLDANNLLSTLEKLDKYSNYNNHEKINISYANKVKSLNFVEYYKSVYKSDIIYYMHMLRDRISKYIDSKSYTDLVGELSSIYDDSANRYRVDAPYAYDLIRNIPNLYATTNKYIKPNIGSEQKERVFINITGPLNDSTKSKLITSILNKLNINEMFEISSDIKDSTYVIEVIIKDNMIDVDRSEPQYQYSKYLAGYVSEVNPDYIEAKNRYEIARSNYYTIGAGNPFLQAIYQGTMMRAAADMNNISSYIEVPRYQDYKYIFQNINIKANISARYNVLDLLYSNNIGDGSTQANDSKPMLYKKNVHDNDSNGNRNTKELTSYDLESFQSDNINKFIDKLSSQIHEIISESLIERAKYNYSRNNIIASVNELAKAIDINYPVYNKTIVDSFSIRLTNMKPDDLFKGVEHENYKKVNVKPKALNYISNKKYKKTKSSVINTKTKKTFKLPVLIKKSLDKVVLVKAMTAKGTIQGSGFFVSSNGIIITNYHVIKDSGDIKVINSKSEEFVSSVVMSDSTADLAILKINSNDNKYFQLANYSDITVGETVIAIGAPHGYEQTVSKGIVSGKRIFKLNSGISLKQIQTDTLMTHGNSGGPLINELGQVIGVNTWTENTDGSVGALNFAVSVDEISSRYQF